MYLKPTLVILYKLDFDIIRVLFWYLSPDQDQLTHFKNAFNQQVCSKLLKNMSGTNNKSHVLRTKMNTTQSLTLISSSSGEEREVNNWYTADNNQIIQINWPDEDNLKR